MGNETSKSQPSTRSIGSHAQSMRTQKGKSTGPGVNCPVHEIFPPEVVTRVMDAVCKVKYQNREKGTGFFGIICDGRKGFQLHGLFTNNHIFDYPDVDEYLKAMWILYREVGSGLWHLVTKISVSHVVYWMQPSSHWHRNRWRRLNNMQLFCRFAVVL